MNFDKIKRDLEKRERGGFWKPKEGKNRIRILPPMHPDDTFYHPVKLHWIGNRPVLCTETDCLVCEIIAMGVVPSIRTIERFLVNIIDLDAPQNGVQIWPMPSTVWADVARLMLEEKWGDITDPVRGRNLVIIRTGSGVSDTRYQIMPDPEISAVDQAWLRDLPDLRKVYTAIEPQRLVDMLRDEGVQINIRKLSAAVSASEPLPSPEPPSQTPAPPQPEPQKVEPPQPPPTQPSTPEPTQPSTPEPTETSNMDAGKLSQVLQELLKG